jgi:hypothetical protein
MSYLAIGSVTKAIAELLEKKLNKPPLMGQNVTLKVTVLPPDDERVDRDNGVNLFLYRVTESPFQKNLDWPGDKENRGVKRPPLALVLHYMVTANVKPSADAAQDDITAHQILGNAMAILHEFPVLNDIHDGDFDADLDAQFAAELRRAFDKIKISFAPISMDDVSKIWTGLSKAYRLSVAYEVSVLQIAPIVPAPLPGPPVQQLHVGVETISAPLITAVEPAIATVGATLTIKGSGFKRSGRVTSVTVGDTTFTEAELSALTEREIRLVLPTAFQRGPKQRVVVIIGGRESNEASFLVRPWIGALRPLRGLTGVPITIPFDLGAGATVSAEVGGQAVAATPDAAGKNVTVIAPNSLANNGPAPVVLIVNDGAAQRSNALFYEVLPVISSRNVTVGGLPAKTTIEVTGQRLKGNDVQVRYGKLLISKGENTSATQLSVEVPRVLPTDQTVSVIVDGFESNILPPSLERLEPTESFPGQQITLTGRGLSGGNVVVHFGAASVNVGPHPYSSRIVVTVPDGLAVGTIQVSATIDGNESNNLSFGVLA